MVREARLGSAEGNGIDQAVLNYVEAARPVQELLQQVLTQVAGYSLMLMTCDKPRTRPEGSIAVARKAANRAHDELRALRVPATAAHHHYHLCKACESTRWAFAAAGACSAPDATDSDYETLTRALWAATENLRATARLLPGFEMIDFGQACCAAHVQAARVARTE